MSRATFILGAAIVAAGSIVAATLPRTAPPPALTGAAVASASGTPGWTDRASAPYLSSRSPRTSSSSSRRAPLSACPASFTCTKTKANGVCRAAVFPCPGSPVTCTDRCGTADCEGICCQCPSSAGSSAHTAAKSSAYFSSSQPSPPSTALDFSACAPFCTSENGKRRCTIVCGNFPSTPAPDALCAVGERLQSFACTLGNAPACAFACTPDASAAFPSPLAGALTGGAPASFRIHVGVTAHGDDGTFDVLLIVVNQGTAAAGFSLSHLLPAGITFLPERSDARCAADGAFVTCNPEMALGGGQSMSFPLTYRIDTCASPVRSIATLRSGAVPAEVARKETTVSLSCPFSSLQPAPPASASAVTRSSAPAAPSSSPPVSPVSSCLPLCAAGGDAASCQTICAAVPGAPLSSRLCADGGKITSFRCTVFPRTSKDGKFPRASCTYACD